MFCFHLWCSCAVSSSACTCPRPALSIELCSIVKSIDFSGVSMLWPSYRWVPLPKSCDSDKPSHVMGEASVKCCVCCCYTLAHACLQALQYKTQATQAQLKAQQETEARKRIEAEAARAVAARMTEKPRVSSPFSSTTGRCSMLSIPWG